jgi:hypothetical protein
LNGGGHHDRIVTTHYRYKRPPLSAFPSGFLRLECAICGLERYANEVRLPHWHDAMQMAR